MRVERKSLMSCCREKTSLPVKFLDSKAQLPSRAHSTDAGLDLYSAEEIILNPGKRQGVSTGVAVAIPDGCVGLVWPRSGLAVNYGLDVMAGVIDQTYRGDLKVVLINHGDTPVMLPPGSKIAQLIIQKVFYTMPVQVDSLDETARGNSGFGSTGV
jgi:dUTP pyrophosphatase